MKPLNYFIYLWNKGKTYTMFLSNEVDTIIYELFCQALCVIICDLIFKNKISDI